jgi:hypothetical protein
MISMYVPKASLKSTRDYCRRVLGLRQNASKKVMLHLALGEIPTMSEKVLKNAFRALLFLVVTTKKIGGGYAQSTVDQDWTPRNWAPKEELEPNPIFWGTLMVFLLIFFGAVVLASIIALMRRACRRIPETDYRSEFRLNEVTIRDLSGAELKGVYHKYAVTGKRGREEILVEVKQATDSFGTVNAPFESAQNGSMPVRVALEDWPVWLFKLYADGDDGKSVFIGMGGRYHNALFFCHHQVVHFPGSANVYALQKDQPKKHLGKVKDVIFTPFTDICAMEVKDSIWSYFAKVKTVGLAKPPHTKSLITIFGSSSGDLDSVLWTSSGMTERIDNRESHQAWSDHGWSGSFGIVGPWDAERPRARFIHTNGKSSANGPNQGFPFDLVATWWDDIPNRKAILAARRAGQFENSEEYFFQYMQDHQREIRDAKEGVAKHWDPNNSEWVYILGGKARYFSSGEVDALREFTKDDGTVDMGLFKEWARSGVDDPSEFYNKKFGVETDESLEDKADYDEQGVIEAEEEKLFYQGDDNALNDGMVEAQIPVFGEGETSEAVKEIARLKAQLSAHSLKEAENIKRSHQATVQAIKESMAPIMAQMALMQKQLDEAKAAAADAQRRSALQLAEEQRKLSSELKRLKAEEHTDTTNKQNAAKLKAKEEKEAKQAADKLVALAQAEALQAAKKLSAEVAKKAIADASPSAGSGPAESPFIPAVSKNEKKKNKLASKNAEIQKLRDQLKALESSNSKAPHKSQGGSSSVTGLKK